VRVPDDPSTRPDRSREVLDQVRGLDRRTC
jgi:hypothetical protein